MMKLHEYNPLQSSALRQFIQSVRARAGVDRAGLFRYDAAIELIQGVIGVDDAGHLEDITGLIYRCGPESRGQLQRVARGESPFEIIPAHDERDEIILPFDRAIVPVPDPAGGPILGVLAVDNA